jgi:CBS domain containing-hemolysin-like protein
LVVAIPAFLLVLEMLPKQLFHRHPLGLLTLMARPLQLLLKIARPWLWCASQFQSRVLHDVPAESDQPSMAALAKSIDSLAVLHPVVGKLLSQAGRLQEMAARDCMMPFKQVSALPPDMPMSAALALCREQNLAWSPVMAADGSMQGWLDTAALPSRIAQDKLVRQYIRPLSQMRATESALRCLQALRRRGEPLGLVIDDKGESVGIITQRSIIGVVLKLNGAHGVAGNGYGTGTGIGTANGNGNGKS